MNRNLRPSVLFVCPRFHTNHRGWVRQLVDEGWNVLAVVAHVGEGENHSDVALTVCDVSSLSRLAERFRVFSGENFPNRGPQLAWAIEYLRNNRPEVVIIRGRAALLSLVFLLAARITRTAVVIYDQEPLYSPHQERLVKRLFDRCAFDSGMTPVFGEKGSRRSSRWTLVPFVVSDADSSNLSALPARRFLSVGKFNSPRKRLDLLIRAAARVFSNGDSLTIIGTSPDGQVPQELREIAGQFDQLLVDFEVNIPHPEMSERFTSFDAFVLPARDEPASVAVVEALAHGLFVVCSDTCGTKEYIPPGRGLCFRTDDEEDLVRALGVLSTPDSIPTGPYEVERWTARSEESRSIVEFVESVVRGRSGR